MFALRKNHTSIASNDLERAIRETQAVVELRPDGTILDASDKFLCMMGYELRDVEGKHHGMFVNKEHRQGTTYKKFWDDLCQGDVVSDECMRIGNEGRELWLQSTYIPVRNRSGELRRIFELVTDVTSRKRLSIDNAGQVAAVRHTQAVIEFNLDGRVLSANDIFLKLMNYRIEEIVGKHHSIFLEARERETPEYREFWAALRRGEYMAAEYKRIGNDGKEVWIVGSYNPIFDERGRIVKILKFASDVSAQRLKAAEYAGQIDAISKSQAVIQFDMDGKVLEANSNFVATMGYSLSEMVGSHHKMFVPKEVAEGVEYREFWSSLRRGEYQAGEYQRVGKGGRSVWIQASYNPIMDLNGNPIKVVKYATDTTRQVLLRMGNERVCQMMDSVAAGAEELNASVREISEAMAKSRSTASVAVDQVEDADSKARKFSEAAEAMHGIVELIDHITGQINLLALNATIEAARAGDAGRGFAVVASEVKNLANQARQATEKISREIGNLNSISSEVAAALTAIKKAIQDVSEYVTTTAAAVEEQSAVTSEMSSSMHRAASEAAAMVKS